jgi:cytochrome c oxidase assembly factor CtaG
MTQHELLMLLAAPLLVLARPLPTYMHALPGRLRNIVARWLRRPALLAVFRFLTAPLVALFIHGVVRWLWHLPSWFQAALASEWVHGLQHASFFLSALLFWWGLVQGRYGRAGYGLSALFVLVTAIHTGALGALLSFSGHVWYPAYSPRLREVHLDPLRDQQLAGLIMWVGAFVWMLILTLAFLLAWLGEARRRVLRGSVAQLARTEDAP